MGPGLKLGVDALVLGVDAVAQILADDHRSGTAKARVFTEEKRGLEFLCWCGRVHASRAPRPVTGVELYLF